MQLGLPGEKASPSFLRASRLTRPSDLIGLPEAAYLIGNVSNVYSPELVVGYSSACCSDHQSFNVRLILLFEPISRRGKLTPSLARPSQALGFPATQLFERAGPIADTKYHNSGDLSDRPSYDFDQIISITKVAVRRPLRLSPQSPSPG